VPSNPEEVQQLVDYPRESLSVELKAWIDLDSPEGQAKIVRGCIAMRNRGSGGFILVGFDDQTSAPDLAEAPSDVRTAFHADKINGLVNRYASQRFEVHVHFPMRDGQEFPVLEVDAGTEALIAARRPLQNTNGDDLVRQHAVYIRSLSQNNTPSTGEPRWADWGTIHDPLFDNREADIGRFLRRQLDRRQIRELGREADEAVEEGGEPGLPPEARALTFLQDGHERFQAVKTWRNAQLPRHGAWEVAVVVEGAALDGAPTEEFLNLVSASNPRHTGWPAWIDSRGFANEEGEHDPGPRPYTYDGGWEAFVHRRRGDILPEHLDFWRAEPAGRFYLYRALRDDLHEGPSAPEPMTALDFGLVITRTAEAIAVPMAFAREMGSMPEETNLHYAFRWSGLRDREISAWAYPERFVSPGYVCHQHEVNSQVAVPLETPTSALGRFIRDATTPLFTAFSGWMPDPGVTEDLTDRFLNRKV
jgi:hypothetical protein